MSGLGLVLSIAKDALAAQQYGMDVTAHNIANVNTDGYSTQSPVNEAKEPAPYGGVLLGRGVDTTHVLRTCDQFIENQLMHQKSAMLSSKALESYMQVLEGLFNENSESSISAMMASFWNMWHDIGNNPSGAAERIALYEHTILLAEQLNTMDAHLRNLEIDLTNAIIEGINKINQITSEIAQVNDQIAGTEVTGVANDLRDKRNTLVSELCEYIDVKTFEQSNGSLTVVTARGCILVHGNDSYDLTAGGDDGSRVQWQATSGFTADITDYITKGKLGGWLDMRDEVVAKYKLDLDAVTKEFIWAVNEQHSQGVGLRLFSGDVTGTYKTGSSRLLSALTYGHKIDYTKDFRMWIDDGSTPKAVTVDMAISTAAVTDWGVAPFNNNGTYAIVVTQGGNISDGAGATKIKWKLDSGAWNFADVNADGTVAIDGKTITFDSTKTLVAGNTFTVNTDAGNDADPLVLTPSGIANSVSDTYTFSVTTGGTIGAGTLEIEWSNGVTAGTITIPASGDYTIDGMTVNFASGTLVAGDTFTITTDVDGNPTASPPSNWHWTLDSFKDQFNSNVQAIFGSMVVEASVTSGNALKFSPNDGYSFGFCDRNFDDCGLLAALGINTFFEGDSAGSAGINAQIANKDYIAAGKMNNNVGRAVPADTNTSTGSVTTAGPYTGEDDTTYTIEIQAGGGTFKWKKEGGDWSGAVNISIGSVVTIDKGVTVGFNPGTYVAGDTFTIAATGSSDPSQTHAAGDNTNALAMCDLQYDARNIAQWTCERRGSNSSANVTATLEDYYHSTVSSIGTKSASISRSAAFYEVMVNKVSEIRDSISAVSLDDEMTNIIKFQHAYAAAAKLISVSDEMLNTLLSTK